VGVGVGWGGYPPGTLRGGLPHVAWLLAGCWRRRVLVRRERVCLAEAGVWGWGSSGSCLDGPACIYALLGGALSVAGSAESSEVVVGVVPWVSPVVDLLGGTGTSAEVAFGASATCADRVSSEDSWTDLGAPVRGELGSAGVGGTPVAGHDPPVSRRGWLCKPRARPATGLPRLPLTTPRRRAAPGSPGWR
jgi:hypothetical protein